MNNAEHEDFLELLGVYRRVTVSRQTLEAAVMVRFLWNTKGRLISLKANVRITTSTSDDARLTIVDSVQVGEMVQVALGAEFVENHEYELREMRKLTLSVGFLQGDEDFIRGCIRDWYRGVRLTPEQYTNVLYRGYHKPITVQAGIGLVTQAGDRIVVSLDPLALRTDLPVIYAEAQGILELSGSATAIVRPAPQTIGGAGGVPSGEMVGIPGVAYQQEGNGIAEILSYIQSGRISVEQFMKLIGEESRYPNYAPFAGMEKSDRDLLILIAGDEDTDPGDFYRGMTRTQREHHAAVVVTVRSALRADPTMALTLSNELSRFGFHHHRCERGRRESWVGRKRATLADRRMPKR